MIHRTALSYPNDVTSNMEHYGRETKLLILFKNFS
jgi:hypothetical protein